MISFFSKSEQRGSQNVSHAYMHSVLYDHDFCVFKVMYRVWQPPDAVHHTLHNAVLVLGPHIKLAGASCVVFEPFHCPVTMNC